MTAPQLDTFSLGDTVRAVLAEQPAETSLGKVCAAVSAAIAPEHREQALQQALVPFVNDILRIGQRRRAHPSNPPTPANPLTKPNSSSPASVTPLRPRPAAPSAKVRAIREFNWQRELTRYHAIDGRGGRAQLGALTREQVQFNIDLRRNTAAATLARADRWARLHADMVAHGVQRVADLPDAVLAAQLDREL